MPCDAFSKLHRYDFLGVVFDFTHCIIVQRQGQHRTVIEACMVPYVEEALAGDRSPRIRLLTQGDL
jgi:hypothetical protein